MKAGFVRRVPQGVRTEMTRRMMSMLVALAFVAPLAVVERAEAAPEFDRGKIVSIDWDQMTMQFKDPKDRIATRRFSRNASVKFTDGAGFFRNPSVRDLRPPMYVHYQFEDEVIFAFDVRELGYTPGNEERASGRKQEGVPRTVVGRVTSFDTGVKHIEMEIDGVRETFQCTNVGDMRGLARGQRVQLKTEWSGQRELVVDVRILSR
jgi:Cu/Ag efflux protein CusF